MRGIIGIEIDIVEITGKWKVSQNRPMADRVGVVHGLETERGTPDSREMAQLVRSFGGLTET